MLLHINEITAVVAIPVLLLSNRGFWPHLWRIIWADKEYPAAIKALVLMTLIINVKGVLRMAYWDLWRPWYADGGQTVHGSIVNASLNSMALAAGVCGLAALYYAIPRTERAGWNWVTAPFYPRPCKFWRRKV